jgi:hypothetical protein
VPPARLTRGRLDLAIDLPDGLRVAQAGDRLVATAPGALLTLAAEPAVADARRSTVQAVAAHLTHLAAARLIDADESPVGATRVLLHHVGESGATCVEEWRSIRDGYLVTLAIQCAAPAYDALADSWAATAASLR